MMTTFAGIRHTCALFLFSLFVFAQSAHGQSCEELFVIDFEGFAEETLVSDQYLSLGVTFEMDGQPGVFPIIAVEGSPTVAFTGSGADSPMASGDAGLTDPIVAGDPFAGGDIRIDFTPPVTSVRMFISDIDGSETYTVRAFDGVTEVDSQTRSGGQAGTGNGVASEYFVAASQIDSVIIEVPALAGFAADFLSFTRQASGDDCIDVLVQQESSPGAGDFEANTLGSIDVFSTNSSASAFYAYDVPEGDSWNGQSLSLVADRSHLLVAETTDGVSLVIVHDRAIPDDPDGGRAEMHFELSGDPDGAFRSVEDDPPGNKAGAGYTGNPGDSVFTSAHNWATCCTDGLALSDLDDSWSMVLSFTEVDGNGTTNPIMGLIEWVAYSSDGTQIPLAMDVDRRVRLVRIAPCPADLNEDGEVNVTDLLALLAAWGTPGGDTNGDGLTNVSDLLILLAAWGPCA